MSCRGRANGPGVNTAIFFELGKLMSEDTKCWTSHCGGYIPVWLPTGTSSANRLDTMRAWGSVLALNMVMQQEGVIRTSFAIAIALIMGSEGFSFTIEYLRLLNPQAAELLDPWYGWPKDTHVPTSVHPSNTADENKLVSHLCALDIDVSLASISLPYIC